MNALILLADGFEVTEALATADVLTRTHQIDVTLCSITSSLTVSSSHGVKVSATKTLSQIDVKDFDFLILPGGKLGVENLHASQEVLALIRAFFSANKDVHAICAAPSILGDLGYLDGLDYTCFPGFQRGNGRYLHQGVVETPHIITGHSMGFSLEFGKTIVRHYLGEKGLERILPGIEGHE